MRKQYTKNKQNSFFGAAFQFLLRLEIFLLVILLALLSVLYFISEYRSTPDYYASTMTGENVQIYPLNEPILTTDFIRQWSERAAQAAFNFDFQNYESQLKKASVLFTPPAWQKFMAQLSSNGLLSQIRDNQIVLSAVATSGATILNRSVISGRYTWRVQVPILLGFQAAGQRKFARWLVTLTIVRMPTLTTPQGILVNNISSGAM